MMLSVEPPSDLKDQTASVGLGMGKKNRRASQKHREGKRARRRQQLGRRPLPSLGTNRQPPPAGMASTLVAELQQMGWHAERRISDGCTACGCAIEFVDGSIRSTTEAERADAPTIMGLPAVVAFDRRCTSCGTLVPYFLAKDPMLYFGEDRFDDLDYRSMVIDLFGKSALPPPND